MGYLISFIGGFIVGSIGPTALMEGASKLMNEQILPLFGKVRSRVSAEINERKNENPPL